MPRLKSFPMSLVTTCRRLLIVGGGHETETRIRHAALFDWYSITIIAPALTVEMAGMAAADARVTLREGVVTEEDIKAADVIIEDCGCHPMAELITQWCRTHGKLINAIDKAELCDLYYMSLIIRDPLIIAISSGGDSPALAAVLRRWLEEQIGAGWQTAARLLADLRRSLPSGHQRMNLLKDIARSKDFQGLVLVNDEPGMRKFIEDAVRRM